MSLPQRVARLIDSGAAVAMVLGIASLLFWWRAAANVDDDLHRAVWQLGGAVATTVASVTVLVAIVVAGALVPAQEDAPTGTAGNP